MDTDRTPALIDAADPPEKGHETPEDEAGWADLAGRYAEMPGHRVHPAARPRPPRRHPGPAGTVRQLTGQHVKVHVNLHKQQLAVTWPLSSSTVYGYCEDVLLYDALFRVQPGGQARCQQLQLPAMCTSSHN